MSHPSAPQEPPPAPLGNRWAPRRLLVVGGAAGIGAWLVRAVFSTSGARITVADIDDRALSVHRSTWGEEIEAVRLESSSDGDLRGLLDPSSFDAVCLAVPISQIAVVAQALFPSLAEGALVFDVASVKAKPMSEMLEAGAGRLSVLGTHPLFGPQVSDIAGETLVLCPSDTTRPAHLEWLEGLLGAAGALLVRTEADAHDELMSFVQVLPHFIYLATADTLRRAEMKLARLWDFQTPPYRSLSSFTGRMMAVRTPAQARLYADVQHLAQRPEVRALFVEACSDLKATIDNGDLAATSSHIETLSEHFSHAEVTYCQSVSGAAADAAKEVEARLIEYRDTGQLCGIRRIDTGRLLFGRVTKVERTELTLVEATHRREGGYGLIYDERSRLAAGALGALRASPRLPRGKPAPRQVAYAGGGRRVEANSPTASRATPERVPATRSGPARHGTDVGQVG